MEKIVKAIAVKYNKFGYRKGDLLLKIESEANKPTYKIAEKSYSDLGHSWQPHNLIIVDETAEIKEDDWFVDTRDYSIHLFKKGIEFSTINKETFFKKIIGCYWQFGGIAPISIEFVREWIDHLYGEVVCEYEIEDTSEIINDGISSSQQIYKHKFTPALQDGYLKLSIKEKGAESKYPHMSEWQSYVDGCMANKRKPLAYVDWISSSTPVAPSILDGTQEIEPPVGSFILEQKDIQGILGNDGMYYHYSKVCELLNRYAASKVGATKWASNDEYPEPSNAELLSLAESSLAKEWVDETEASIDDMAIAYARDLIPDWEELRNSGAYVTAQSAFNAGASAQHRIMSQEIRQLLAEIIDKNNLLLKYLTAEKLKKNKI